MKKKRIYILPTGFGFLFILSAVIMILVGATYQNNLVNLLAFFMLSLIFVAMVQTNENLKDLDLEALEIESSFAGGKVLVTTVLHNSAKEPRFNLEFQLRKLKLVSAYDNVHPILSQSTLKLRAAFRAGLRGRHKIDRVKLSTTYPLGLFRSWVWIGTDSSYFIYPEARGSRPLPIGGAGSIETGNAAAFSGDDFHGHRKFQSGDSARHIDWKAHARGRPLLTKEFTEGTAATVYLDWDQLPHLETETRLSQLSAWVDEAKRRQLSFSLRLPHRFIPEGHGPQHATLCWEALAEFPADDPAQSRSS